MLIRYPRTVMVNKENYYREYKSHTKWLSLISNHFAQKYFFGHDTSWCSSYLYYMCKVSESFSKKLWYKLISSCMHYLSTSILNRKKWLSCQKLIFYIRAYQVLLMDTVRKSTKMNQSLAVDYFSNEVKEHILIAGAQQLSKCFCFW